MELNEDLEMFSNSQISLRQKNNIRHRSRSDVLNLKRIRNQKDSNEYLINYPAKKFFDNDVNYFYENDFYYEYDHSIKSLSTNEESCSIKNNENNQMISQLKKDLCPNNYYFN